MSNSTSVFGQSNVSSLSAFEELARSNQVGVSNWRNSFSEFVAQSPNMLKVLEMVSKVAKSDSAVLITGESGTGKELIAAAIHRLSNRASKRFVALNCSAIPEELLESHLFGHEKGAFTGAERKHEGYFQNAAGGTIFLDEIGDMPMRLQAKLLRVLQDKQFTPVGGTHVLRSDVRVVAATNVNLEKAMTGNSFRSDLYYRLNVFPVHVPPLRERRADVLLLIQYFIEQANLRYAEIEPCFFSERALVVLTEYDWPGNVRELQNVVERSVLLKGAGIIDLDHLPAELIKPVVRNEGSVNVNQSLVQDPANLKTAERRVIHPSDLVLLPDSGMSLIEFIEKVENDLILQALERTNNNRNQAAKLLGLNRTTLVERIKKRQLVPLNAPTREF